jgi:hypothetical protein
VILYVRLALGALLSTALLACVDNAALFGPGPPPEAPRMVLPMGELQLYEDDTLRVEVPGAENGLTAQLLVVDSARAVHWRSALVPVDGNRAELPISAVPAAVQRGGGVFLTGVLTRSSGQRLYATDDSASATQLSGAALRSLRLWAGRRVVAPGAAVPSDLVLAPEFAMGFYGQPNAGLGTLDLSADGEVGPSYATSVTPIRLAYRGGVLATLGSGGSALGFHRVTSDGVSEPVVRLLPPMDLELDTLLRGGVRPFAHAIRLGCDEAECRSVFAVVTSQMQLLDGTARGGGSSVLRLEDAPTETEGGPARPPLVIPAYHDVLAGDTALAAKVFTPASDGSRRLMYTRSDASACLATSIGGDVLAAGGNGVLYVAPAGPQAPCGPGSALLRIENAGTGEARASVLGIRNTMADDRISGIVGLELSPDGSFLLVQVDDGVLLVDASLRVLGRVSVAGARQVAWASGPGSPRFVVADDTGATVFDARTLAVVARIECGPVQGPMVFLSREGRRDVLAAPVEGGFVVVQVTP